MTMLLPLILYYSTALLGIIEGRLIFLGATPPGSWNEKIKDCSCFTINDRMEVWERTPTLCCRRSSVSTILNR